MLPWGIFFFRWYNFVVWASYYLPTQYLLSWKRFHFTLPITLHSGQEPTNFRFPLHLNFTTTHTITRYHTLLSFQSCEVFVKPKLLLSPSSHKNNNMASTPLEPGDFNNLNDTAVFQIRSSVEFYFKSIHENMPAFYLPKEIAQSMGVARLAKVAHNYA